MSLLWWENLHRLCELFSVGLQVHSPIHLVSLFIYITIDVDICFKLWIIIQYHFVYCSDVSTVGHWEGSFSWLWAPWSYFLHCEFCCCCVHSLLSATIRCFRFVFHISCISPRKSSCFSKKPWFLLLENDTRNQIWMLDQFVGIRELLLLRKKVFVCMLTCYTHICKYFYV